MLVTDTASVKYGGQLLTTWLILETLDWRMVTASPIDGFLLTIAEALKALC